MNKSTRDAFGQVIVSLGKKEKNLVVVSMDLASSLRLKDFAQKFPNRFFEIGVAEQNAVGIAAGLAIRKKIVFLVSFAAFSPGLNWGQIRQSICLNNLGVKIIGGHAGLSTGPDGATHQMLEDVALMRVLPNMRVLVPIDYKQTKKVIRAAVRHSGPFYIRLARPETPQVDTSRFSLEKAEILKRGKRAGLIGYGPILAEVWTRYEQKLRGVQIVNCPVIKPLDKQTIIKTAQKTRKVIVIEDHQKAGGLGEAIGKVLLAEKVGLKLFAHIAMPNKFGESAHNYLKLWQKYYFNDLEKILKKL